MSKDMQRMMKQAQKMAADMQKAQAELAEIELEGSAGGGAEMLGDAVVAAINDAMEKVRAKQAEALGPLGGLGLPGM